jgi:hypothetical protein
MNAWRADPLVWGHGPRIFEVFLEPTCPFSVKAFGKLDDLLDQAGRRPHHHQGPPAVTALAHLLGRDSALHSGRIDPRRRTRCSHTALLSPAFLDRNRKFVTHRWREMDSNNRFPTTVLYQTSMPFIVCGDGIRCCIQGYRFRSARHYTEPR